MKKDRKFLNKLDECLGNIDSKYKAQVISKYENIIIEEKAKKRKITEILKELGDPELLAEQEKEIYLNKSVFNKIKVKLNSIFKKNSNKEKSEKKKEKEKLKEEKKKIKLEKKELKKRIKEETKEDKKPFKERFKEWTSFLKKDINFKKKDKKIVEENIIEDVIEDARDEVADVSEIVPEEHIFESKKTRHKRILLKSLGVILISLLLFIWLWITVVFIAGLFAYLDGVKFIGMVLALFGLDLLFLWIIVMINRLIFKKRNNLRLNLIIVIVSIVLIALGIVLFIRKLSKVESVNDVTIKYNMTNKISTYSLPVDPEEKFYLTFNSNYKTQYMINYDETLDDKIKLEVKYFECYYDYYVKKTTNNLYVSLGLDNRDRLSVYIDDLKEGKIFNNDELSRYIVKISIHPDQAERLVIQD